MLHDTAHLSGLLAAISHGDRVAFRDLYDRTAPKLLGVVLRIVKDRAVAEDIVQEAYLRIWTGAGSYDPAAGRPMTWLITVARNRAIDVVRTRRPEPTRSLDDEENGPGDIADPRDAEQAFVDADRLKTCLARLDEAQRRCFLAAYLDGFSREELAQRFDRPVNTIKTWLHRGAMSLRACLDDA